MAIQVQSPCGISCNHMRFEKYGTQRASASIQPTNNQILKISEIEGRAWVTGFAINTVGKYEIPTLVFHWKRLDVLGGMSIAQDLGRFGRKGYGARRSGAPTPWPCLLSPSSESAPHTPADKPIASVWTAPSRKNHNPALKPSDTGGSTARSTRKPPTRTPTAPDAHPGKTYENRYWKLRISFLSSGNVGSCNPTRRQMH